MKTKLILTLSGLGLFFLVHAQNEDCIKDFNYMINKIKTDYPGYHDKVTKSTEKDLAALELKLRKKIDEHPDSCGKYLNEYAEWFRDFHLKVRNNGSKNRQGTTGKSKPDPIVELNNDTILALGKKHGTLEGLWNSFRGKIAIRKGTGNSYYGIVIQQNGYKPGQIMFEFTEGNKGEITANYFARENHFRAIPVVASLHMDARILEIHGFLKFVRQSGSKASDHAFLSSYRAEFPNGNNTYPLAYYLNDSTFFLRIPDFEDEQAELLVKAHWKEIISRPFLIVDIRNNGGGLDDFFQSLLSLVYTNPYNVTGVKWYASEGNIRNSEEAINSGDVRNGEEGIKWLKELVDAMKKNPGGFVLHPEMGGDAIEKRDTIYPYPRKVGIIINEGNGSAAEQFILEAKESKKVILFGNHNTAGVLDYSNRVQEDFPSGNYLFFWPMTRSMRLPDHPIDNIGISPDVNIPFPETDQLYGRLDDWVYFVKEYLEFNEK